jgi:disease resistance protein RPM1
MEFVASMALRPLLPKLAQLLQSEYKLQKGAKKGIEDMCTEIEAMDVFIRKVSEVPRDQLDEQHKIWAREVRDLSYDMEDMVDTFMVDVEGPDAPSSKSTFEKFFRKMKKKINNAMTRREIAKEIMDIKKRVIEVADRHKRSGIDTSRIDICAFFCNTFKINFLSYIYIFLHWLWNLFPCCTGTILMLILLPRKPLLTLA